MKKVIVKQDEKKEVPVEVLATSIKSISEGMRKMMDGPYFFDEGVDPWDEARDARNYAGPHPVVAHPPCERWGRYWGGGPMLHGTPRQKKLGDDGGCFAAALDAVRRFGGVLEHPEASHAFRHFGLPRPSFNGGWTEPDQYGGGPAAWPRGTTGTPRRR